MLTLSKVLSLTIILKLVNQNQPLNLTL